MIQKSTLLFSLIFLLAQLITATSYAQEQDLQEIEISSLGSLNLQFKPVVTSDFMQSQKIFGTASVKVGESYVLTTPTNIQQLRYLKNNGEKIRKGDVFARLSGSEVHHFLSEIVAAKALFELSEQRMRNSKKLFEKKLIEEEKWLTINQNYYASSLKYEHMRHFEVLIDSINESDESITLSAPIDGILKQEIVNTRLAEGDTIASFIPESSVRLHLKLTPYQVNGLDYVEVNRCRLNISSVSNITSDAFISVWTDKITSECNIRLGEQILATPFYKQRTYRIAKTAVFELDGKDKILLRSENMLRAMDVSLLTLVGEDYIILSDVDLTDASILVSSVSAVQGIMLGLGGE